MHGTFGYVFLEAGSGEIPNRDFKGSGGLVTNTSAVSNASFVRFVASGGPIAREWRSEQLQQLSLERRPRSPLRQLLAERTRRVAEPLGIGQLGR